MSELEMFETYFKKHPYTVKPYARLIGGHAYTPIWRQPTLYIDQFCPREVVEMIRRYMMRRIIYR